MTRSIFAAVAVGFVGLAFGPAVLQGCKQTGVGDPCVPEQEYDPTFNGFDEKEVNVESKSFQCQTRLCLVNHFRGRVSCPLGQSTDGTGRTADGSGTGTACTVPGATDKIVGDQQDPKKLACVSAQCADRTADNAVYCSCRCANLEGKTDDGANYCTCPDGFSCSQLVTSIGQGDTGLTGAYCVKSGTAYDAVNSCQSDLAGGSGKCP